jgi:hypothetical protein
VCCDSGFRCSPFQPNDVPGGCPYQQACPTLGAADPASAFHGKVKDQTYPQANQDVRRSSPMPDWPVSSLGVNYAMIYRKSSPGIYGWQYDDIQSTYTCCSVPDKTGPAYVVTFCP